MNSCLEQEKILFIRMAQEPLWKDRGAPQTEYRTHEHYAQIYLQNGEYIVEFGYERGTLQIFELKDRENADFKMNELIHEYEMEEDCWKTVQEENKKLSLEEIIRCYFSEGDFLHDICMDETLDRIRADTHIQYRYKNIYSNSNGFLAEVTMWKNKRIMNKKVTERVKIFIENDGMGEMVKEIRSV